MLAVVILLALIAGAYALYLWLNEPKGATSSAPVAQPSAQRQITTTKPPADVPIGSSIQSLSSPVAPGENVSLMLRTTESAKCTIKVVYIDSQMHERARVTDSGLGEKTADDFGMVTWTWTMPANAALATWQADVTCQRGNKSTHSIGNIVVQKAKS